MQDVRGAPLVPARLRVLATGEPRGAHLHCAARNRIVRLEHEAIVGLDGRRTGRRTGRRDGPRKRRRGARHGARLIAPEPRAVQRQDGAAVVHGPHALHKE